MIKSRRGIATVDFLFALILVCGFSFITFALSMTLTMIEVTQYITFTAARAYYAGHVNEAAQLELGTQNYEKLIGSEPLKPLYSGGWFELSQVSIGSNLSSTVQSFKDYKPQDSSQDLFHGAFVSLKSKVLAFSIPLYGSTEDDDLRGGNSFSMTIGSYLGREVTHEECENMLANKWKYIKELNAGSNNAQYSDAGDSDRAYAAIYDNGC